MNHTVPTMPVANLRCDAKMNQVRVAYVYIYIYVCMIMVRLYAYLIMSTVNPAN